MRLASLLKVLALGVSLAASLGVGEWLWRAAVRATYERTLREFDHSLLGVDREHGYGYGLRRDVDELQHFEAPSGAVTAVRWRTNGDRFRHHDVWPPPDDGTPRILFVGDSYTFGFGVADGEAFPHQCERILREHGVPAFAINAGVPGYNSRQQLASLLEILPRYRPDLVVLGFLPNDAEPMTYVPPPPETIHGPSWLFEDSKALLNGLGVLLIDDAPLFRSRRIEFTLDYNTSFAPGNPKGDDCLAAIAAMRALCVDANVPFVMAVLPVFALPFGDAYPLHPVHDRVLTFAEREGIAAIDVLADVRGLDSNTLQVPGDGHPNAEGHRRIAEILVPELERRLR